MPTMEVTTPIASSAAFERLALLDMGLQISDVPPAFGPGARPAGKAGLAQGLPHGLAAGAVARGIDLRLGDGPRHRTGCRGNCRNGLPRRTMTRLRRRRRYARIGIDDAGGLQRIDDAERPIEPARDNSGFRDATPPAVSVPAFALVPITLPMPSISAVRPASGSLSASQRSERIWASENVGLWTPVL